MILRPHHFEIVLQRLAEFPVAAIIGARHAGKTTLARAIAANWGSNAHHFDLQDPRSDAVLSSPMLALEPLRGLVVLDEIQRRPDLFSVLRVLADRPDSPTRFLILGSASPDLIRRSADSLAGRIAYHELPGIDALELSASSHDRHDGLDSLWRRGGFPRALLAASDTASERWRREFIRTFLERDIPELGIRLAPATLRRFWMMLAHYHGQIFNASEIGASLQLSDVTAKRYLDILSGTFMIRQLSPWYENIGKRQIKRPKIYFRDSGIFHRLLLFDRDETILNHPKLGASWEGFVIEEVIRVSEVPAEQIFFWGIHGQVELDLLIFRNGKRWGIEVKYQDAPKLTPSMTKSIEQLGLAGMKVIYPGETRYSLSPAIEVIPVRECVVGLW